MKLTPKHGTPYVSAISYQATVKEKLLAAEPSSKTRKEKTPPVVEPPEEAAQVEVRRVEKSMETQNGRMMIWGVS